MQFRCLTAYCWESQPCVYRPPYATGANFASRNLDHAYNDFLEGVKPGYDTVGSIFLNK